MEASMLPLQHKYLPKNTILIQHLLSSWRDCLQLSNTRHPQDECCNVEVIAALVVLKACQEADLRGRFPLRFLNAPLGTLSILENEDWQIACLFLFCLFCKCQEGYEEDKTENEIRK